MPKGKYNIVVNYVGRIHMNTDPFWFYNLVVFFDEDKNAKLPKGILSFYSLFIDQLNMKLFEEQMPISISNSRACFFYLN